MRFYGKKDMFWVSLFMISFSAEKFNSSSGFNSSKDTSNLDSIIYGNSIFEKILDSSNSTVLWVFILYLFLSFN